MAASGTADPQAQPAHAGDATAAVAAAASARRKPEDSSYEFLRGALAALANIVITFPVHKLIFRQQVEGKSAVRAARGIAAEGLVNVYRGVGPPLVQKSLSMAAMFGLYDMYLRAIVRSLRQRNGWSAEDIPTAWRVGAQASAALLAGSTEAILTPLERAQTLLQHRHFNGHFTHTWDVMQKLRPLGVKEYYRGLVPILLRNGPSSVLFFTLRGPVRDIIPSKPSRFWDIMRDFVSGAVLGATISTIFFPLNVAKSVIQAQLGGKFPGVMETVRRVKQERGGWRGVFRGVHINYTRSLVSWGIINSTYEILGDLLGVDATV